MKQFLSTLCASALVASVAATGAVPAYAGPAYVPKASVPQAQSNVIDVQSGPNWRRPPPGPGFRPPPPPRPGFRPPPPPPPRWNGSGPRYGWYNGHRGYRYKRPGYRYYNGFWFPAGAFVAGAIIGGAIANSNTQRGNSAHVEWCYNRYRSYRASDNTFQPYNGPRRQCYSPYS